MLWLATNFRCIEATGFQNEKRYVYKVFRNGQLLVYVVCNRQRLWSPCAYRYASPSVALRGQTIAVIAGVATLAASRLAGSWTSRHAVVTHSVYTGAAYPRGKHTSLQLLWTKRCQLGQGQGPTGIWTFSTTSVRVSPRNNTIWILKNLGFFCSCTETNKKMWGEIFF